MSFRFKLDESLPEGLQRILRKQFDKAHKELTGQAGTKKDKAVHEARKCIKRIRAVVRLFRQDLGPKTCRREQAALRAAAQPLSEVRDAQIFVDAVVRLGEHFSGEIDRDELAGIKQALSERRNSIYRHCLEDQGTLAATATALEQTHAHIKSWKVKGNWSTIAHGLQRICIRGQEAFDVALASPTMENLHELRKRVKDLGYQLELLEPMRPEAIAEMRRQADELAESLGDDHDLAVLHQVLLDDPAIQVDPVALGHLLTLIERRRAELQEQSLHLARGLYVEKPKRLVDRLETYWHAWRSGTGIVT